jgi:hypothetical protein
MAIASIVSYLAGDLIAGFASLPVQLVAGTLVFYFVYFRARRWLQELRGD